MAKVTIKEFFDQVKSEAKKVTWPERKEVGTHLIIVLVLVLIASLFFMVTDLAVFNIIQYLLKF